MKDMPNFPKIALDFVLFEKETAVIKRPTASMGRRTDQRSGSRVPKRPKATTQRTITMLPRIYHIGTLPLIKVESPPRSDTIVISLGWKWLPFSAIFV